MLQLKNNDLQYFLKLLALTVMYLCKWLVYCSIYIDVILISLQKCSRSRILLS